MMLVAYDKSFHLPGARKQKVGAVARVPVSSQRKSPLGSISYNILHFLLISQARDLMHVETYSIYEISHIQTIAVQNYHLMTVKYKNLEVIWHHAM